MKARMNGSHVHLMLLAEKPIDHVLVFPETLVVLKMQLVHARELQIHGSYLLLSCGDLTLQLSRALNRENRRRHSHHDPGTKTAIHLRQSGYFGFSRLHIGHKIPH
jgi:hypothetical protein